jgi:transcription elongation GreA/GreB family factor
MTGRTHIDDVVLTTEGRRMLAERARRLREETIPVLVNELADENRDGRIDMEYLRAVHELRRVTALVAGAGTVTDLPDRRRDVVEMGDQVTIRLENGDVATYVVVHPEEAPLDDRRISSGSPLSRALLGRRMGETVHVSAPAGDYRCTIVAIDRMA